MIESCGVVKDYVFDTDESGNTFGIEIVHVSKHVNIKLFKIFVKK